MFLNDEDMVECPYNSTHRMLRKRLQPHLLKCRRHYKDVELRKCPFNITHLIPEPEFTHHATNCPDRKLITQYKYNAPEQKEEEVPKHAPVECDENWDDTHVTDYNPKLHLKKANVLLKPDGASRSERKLFVKEERKRLGDNEDSSDDSITHESTSSRNKRQKYDYRSDSGTRDEAYEQQYRYRRLMSSSSSSIYRQHSRSPACEIYTRSPLHSPTAWRRSPRQRSRSPSDEIYVRNPLYSSTASRRSPREYSPPTRRSPSYTSKYALPSHSHFDGSEDCYQNKRRRSPSNDQYNSGRETYNKDYRYQYYNGRYSEPNYVMPEAPPPPMISYSPSSTSSSRYSYPPFSYR